MRILESIKWFLLAPLYPGFQLADRPRILFYYAKSLLNRFLLKRKPSNRLIKLKFRGEPLYFRDNWFDPRSIYTVFSNDYTRLDRALFNNLRNFVDVGANMGLVSRCARTASPGCRIVCFEPVPENAELCRMNNPEAAIETYGVGSKAGITELLVDECGFMASSVKFGYRQDKRKVKIIALDDYFKDSPEVIDLLKIDVEGMENEVLKGAKATLRKTKKVVAEVHSPVLLKQFGMLMSQHGFIEKKTEGVDKEVYITEWTNTSSG